MTSSPGIRNKHFNVLTIFDVLSLIPYYPISSSTIYTKVLTFFLLSNKIPSIVGTKCNINVDYVFAAARTLNKLDNIFAP